MPKKPNGAATVETLHSFQSSEGTIPEGGVLIGADGAFYGGTNSGGAFNAGTVFRVDPTTFALTKLHDFNPGAKDGSAAIGGLTAGPHGLLYGTTAFGGPSGGGTVFAISPKGDKVSYAIVHGFGGAGDGNGPYLGRLVSSGNMLFGTTMSDAMNGFGTAFELTLTKSGWSESVIHQFGSAPDDFVRPANGLVLDQSGTLYGCAQEGKFGAGGVFALKLGGGAWSETVIKAFGMNPNDPLVAECALVMDPAGRLIGTSSNGGKYGGGTVFVLTPEKGEAKLTVSHSFGPESGVNAWEPDNALIAIADGYYAGTAVMGGKFGDGAVFEILP